VISQTIPEWAPKFLFEDKISNSLSGWCLFTFVWGYMAGVNGLAGHELIHRRETFNKGLGMLTFSKIFYSHFLLEHSSGHHRNVATPEDSATARVGENFFIFTLRSAIGGHMNTWNREVSRLQTKYECEKVPLITLLTENRMTWFATLQLSIMALIWCVMVKTGLQKGCHLVRFTTAQQIEQPTPNFYSVETVSQHLPLSCEKTCSTKRTVLAKIHNLLLPKTTNFG
jgi:hypothetical protein